MNRSFARRTLLTTGAALTGTALLPPLPAAARASGAAPARWPTRFPLPDGFQPEGIAIGSRPYAYFGSLRDGSIHGASLATGRGRIISKGTGAMSVGLKLDSAGRLFIGGGYSRQIRVVDTHGGAILATYDVGTATSMVNDVVLRPGVAWFTDSFNPVLYGLPLGRRGELPPTSAIVTRELTGDWAQGSAFTANGIERTPDGRALLVVNTVVDGGALMRVDPRTGVARQVDLGPLKIPNGDGLLLLGRLLYVVQQSQNAIDVVRLNASGTRGVAVARITDPRFRIPTTAAAWGDRILLPNARFDVPPTPDTEYDVVSVRRV
ncbi:superoxide dismutase [Streptomyces sp. H27-C3]|uniref:superoxide dismutase n=1 Tax=Streptomyces sp. H27-C3 TaxID=3046305 RepID=UPI0024B9A535|nr:superoxide dismutase [Streptomyces sp. H27-C3]MDJ0463342.1 superoxide dismutase [Streptomyces sp. H27-C3]